MACWISPALLLPMGPGLSRRCATASARTAAASQPTSPAIRFRRCRRSAMTRARTSGHLPRPGEAPAAP